MKCQTFTNVDIFKDFQKGHNNATPPTSSTTNPQPPSPPPPPTSEAPTTNPPYQICPATNNRTCTNEDRNCKDDLLGRNNLSSESALYHYDVMLFCHPQNNKTDSKSPQVVLSLSWTLYRNVMVSTGYESNDITASLKYSFFIAARIRSGADCQGNTCPYLAITSW